MSSVSSTETPFDGCAIMNRGQAVFRFIIICFMSFTCKFVNGQSIANRNKCFTKPDTLDGNEVFSTVTRQPEYPGGLQQFYKDVLKKLKHPNERGKLSEKLTFTFIIDKEGHVRNFCFIDPTDGRHDNQIDSVVSNIDNWSPGELYNRKVNTRMLLPMTVEWQ
jgi:hypothetical protein